MKEVQIGSTETRQPSAKVFVGAHVDPALRRGLALLARQNDRSVSAELRLAARRHLEQHELQVV
jgi:hypothetical protein